MSYNSSSLSFSHSAFPNSSRFLKAIRHYRICQLRSSKHFSGIAVHRKLYKNISSYLICQVPSYSAFSLSLFEILEPPLVLSRLSSPALRVFLILSNETNYYYFFFSRPKGNEKRKLDCLVSSSHFSFLNIFRSLAHL